MEEEEGMTIQILRDMGRKVPENCQDPESEEYAHWLAQVFEDILNEGWGGEVSIHRNQQMVISRGEKILIINATRGEEGIWQVK